MIPEFVGRLPVTVSVDPLDEDALVAILTEPKNAIVKQFQRLFELDHVELTFTPEALRAAAQQAMKLRTGARGLRTIIEQVLLDVMYEVPSRPEVVKCVVNAECITRGSAARAAHGRRGAPRPGATAARSCRPEAVCATDSTCKGEPGFRAETGFFDNRRMLHGRTDTSRRTRQARMVDVGAKAETEREAVAAGRVSMRRETLALLRAGNLPKGDVLGTARVAGIMAAKRTSELIPLCHPLLLTHVAVDFAFDEEEPAVEIRATVRCKGQTGVEMEALTAVSVAALTIYDMAKAVERGMVIGDIRLLEKRGGKSGEWSRWSLELTTPATRRQPHRL